MAEVHSLFRTFEKYFDPRLTAAQVSMRNFRGWSFISPVATSPPLPHTAKLVCGFITLAVSQPLDAAIISFYYICPASPQFQHHTGELCLCCIPFRKPAFFFVLEICSCFCKSVICFCNFSITEPRSFKSSKIMSIEWLLMSLIKHLPDSPCFSALYASNSTAVRYAISKFSGSTLWIIQKMSGA